MQPTIFNLFYDRIKPYPYPKNYFAWGLLAVMSALLGKKCFIENGNRPVYFQLYILLLGGMGTGKSTARDQGVCSEEILSQSAIGKIAFAETTKRD